MGKFEPSHEIMDAFDRGDIEALRDYCVMLQRGFEWALAGLTDDDFSAVPENLKVLVELAREKLGRG